jgi:hypothetical protein
MGGRTTRETGGGMVVLGGGKLNREGAKGAKFGGRWWGGIWFGGFVGLLGEKG